GRDGTSSPGYDEQSHSTSASSGSPSAARGPATKPQTNGKESPLGNGRDSIISPLAGSNLILIVDPRGVSTTTFKYPSSRTARSDSTDMDEPRIAAHSRHGG